MRQRWKRGEVRLTGPSSQLPVPIVADGAIATTILGEGRLIPVLIIETSARPDIDELVTALQRPPPGDATSRWGRLHWHKRSVVLVLSFERPSQVGIVLEFNIADQGILVDSILTSKALYLQPGRLGDRLSSSLESPRIFVEVPDLGFKSEWDRMWPKAIAAKLRQSGLSRTKAKEAAEKAISMMRDVERFRMRRSQGGRSPSPR